METQEKSDLATALCELAQSPSIEAALAATRDVLGMDVAYTSEITGDAMTPRALDGDGRSFLLAVDTAVPGAQTYCRRVLNGRLPSVIADVRGDDRAASLAITELGNVGAFTSVPLRFSDGRLYGTLCSASHRPMPSLGYRELQFLHVVARIVADRLEREELRGTAPPGSLLSMTCQLRTEALDLLETAGGHPSRAGNAAGVVDGLQHVANDLGAVERLLQPAAASAG